MVTLAERNGEISIAALTLDTHTALNENNSTFVFGKLFVGTRSSDARLVNFLIDCLRQDLSNLRYDPDTVAHAMEAKNWDQHIETSPFEGNSVYLPYHGQPSDLTYADLLRIYVFHMPEFDTRYRFPLYLDKNGYVYFGENNPD